MVRILAYGKPFFGNLARILGRVKGFVLPPPRGVALFFPSLRPWPWACPVLWGLSRFRPCSVLPWGLPAACPPAKNRPSVRPCGRFERLRACGLWSVGSICLCAYLVKIGTRGENFHPKFLSLCASFSRPVLSIIGR